MTDPHTSLENAQLLKLHENIAQPSVSPLEQSCYSAYAHAFTPAVPWPGLLAPLVFSVLGSLIMQQALTANVSKLNAQKCLAISKQEIKGLGIKGPQIYSICIIIYCTCRCKCLFVLVLEQDGRHQHHLFPHCWVP